MSKEKNQSEPALTKISGERVNLKDLLGPPPLLPGEDAAAYEALRLQIASSVKPKDALEEIWIEDVVYRVWELSRLRRLRAALFSTAAYEGVSRVLLNLVRTERVELAQGWINRDERSRKRVAELLEKAGLDEDVIVSETLAARIETFEKIDKMIMAAEVRRDAALRELQRHREILAIRVRDFVDDYDDAEFREIENRGEGSR